MVLKQQPTAPRLCGYKAGMHGLLTVHDTEAGAITLTKA
jgi:hypothetical protein